MDDSKIRNEHEIDDEATKSTLQFFKSINTPSELPENTTTHDFYSEILRTLLKLDRISHGHVSCSFTASPPTINYFKGLNGAVVAAVAERVATACARTMVAEDKPLFLGEQSISYLSSASMNAELIADASVVRSGRNLTVVSMEIKLKETKKLVYTSQATFYQISPSKL